MKSTWNYARRVINMANAYTKHGIQNNNPNRNSTKNIIKLKITNMIYDSLVYPP